MTSTAPRAADTSATNLSKRLPILYIKKRKLPSRNRVESFEQRSERAASRSFQLATELSIVHKSRRSASDCSRRERKDEKIRAARETWLKT